MTKDVHRSLKLEYGGDSKSVPEIISRLKRSPTKKFKDTIGKEKRIKSKSVK